MASSGPTPNSANNNEDRKGNRAPATETPSKRIWDGDPSVENACLRLPRLRHGQHSGLLPGAGATKKLEVPWLWPPWGSIRLV